MHLPQLLDDAKAVLGKLIPASLGVRLIIGSAIGVLGNSSILGFISELGAVNFALAYGARLPTEGLPFLRYATSVVSFCIFIAALSAFGIFYYIIVAGVRNFHADILFKHGDTEIDIKKLSLPTYLKRYTITAVVAAIFISQFIVQFHAMQLLPHSKYLILTIPIMTIVILVVARNKSMTKWLLLAAFIVINGVFLYLIFTPDNYSRALIYTRQGGGIPIEVNLKQEFSTKELDTINGYLFLKTKDYYILTDALFLRFQELPIDAVRSVSYPGEQRWGRINTTTTKDRLH